MRKKILSLTLAATMLMSCMVGCGGTTESTEANTAGSADAAVTTEAAAPESIEGEITVLTHRTDIKDTKMVEYAAKFNETYPNVTVAFEAMEDYEGDVSNRLATGDYGDVFMIPNTIPVEEFADFLEPLGTLEELSENYEEKYLYTKQSGGTVYGLPSGVNVSSGIVYNKAVFEKAGITEMPRTPEEFQTVLATIKDKTDAIPLYTNTHDAWCIAQWQACVSAASADPTYVNDKMSNEATPFDAGDPAYNVYKVLYDSVKNGVTEADPFTTEWEGSKLMMAKGEVACMVLGSWALSQMKEVGEQNGLNPDDLSYMPFPISNEAGEIVVGAAPDYCYGVNVNSENKAAAKAFVKFMVEESGYAQDAGEISIVKGQKFPEALTNFENCALQVDEPAQPENEGKWDTVHNQSELGLWSGSEYQVKIVEAAFGNVDMSFDDIMAEWNEKWSAALEAVNADWQK